MAGTNEMGSVEGQLVGLPLAGPETFSVQQLAYLKRALGLDETDLISSSKECSSGATFQLSESIANFERVKIYCARNPSANSNVCNEVLVGSAYYYIQASFVDGSSLLIDTAQLTISGTTVTVNAIARKTLAATTLTTSTNAPMTITKIVGVHRIAGGN